AVLSRSNQTELTEPPPLSRSNVPANPVSLPPYRSNIIILFDAMPVFLVIFISQSVQSPLRNINSPFGFHGAVNLSSDSNKRFVYDVGAYNSDDDKADQNVGTLIGKGGEIVRNLQLSSGVKI
ncbi:BnaAnng21460D, partial [Brassica napus]